MILTGKALHDFGDKCRYDYFEFKKLEKTLQNSLIIEWFDSAGVVINIGGVLNNGIYRFVFDIQQNNTLNGTGSDVFNSRREATNAAIEKAKEIYNEKHK